MHPHEPYRTQAPTPAPVLTKGRKAASLGLYLVAANAIVGAATHTGGWRLGWVAVAAVAMWQGTLWLARGTR